MGRGDWLDADHNDGPNADVHTPPVPEEVEPTPEVKSCSTVAPSTIGGWAFVAGLAGLMLRRRRK